jgi:hypothetical protein
MRRSIVARVGLHTDRVCYSRGVEESGKIEVVIDIVRQAADIYHAVESRQHRTLKFSQLHRGLERDLDGFGFR